MAKQRFEDKMKDAFKNAELNPSPQVWNRINHVIENMEGETFENSIKDVFRNAEVSPSAPVWNSIELDIIKAESETLRNRMVFFKLLAAASVVFGLAVAGATLLFFQSSMEGNQIAYRNNTATQNEGNDQPTQAESLKDRKDDAGNSSNIQTSDEGIDAADKRNQTKSDRGNLMSKGTDDSAIAASKPKGKTSGRLQKGAVQLERGSDNGMSTLNESFASGNGIKGGSTKHLNGMNAVVDDRNNDPEVIERSHTLTSGRPQLAYVPEVRVKLPEESKPDEVALMLARLNDFEKAQQSEEKKSKTRADEKLWTSVGFAAGAFTGGTASISQPSAAMSSLVADASNEIADKEANAAGSTYSVGVNMGTRVSNRWVLQGGLNYMTQSSDYTVNNAFSSPDLKTFTPPSINEMPKIMGDTEVADAKMVTTAPYNVNNNVQYLSVPLQAGYLVLNKKFGIQLNAGVATDMFLRNEKTAEGSNLQKIDQGRDESPYRPFNFSGLMGAEFSYKLGLRYRLALNPGVKYPLNSIYKSDVGVKANPLTYDVGLRFRYIFQ